MVFVYPSPLSFGEGWEVLPKAENRTPAFAGKRYGFPENAGLRQKKFFAPKPNPHFGCLITGTPCCRCRNTKGSDAVNAAAFQAQAKQIEKLLYRIAWTYLGNNQDVEDVVQDALMKAWEKRDTLRDRTQFKPWLARILANQCKNMLRRRRKIRFCPLDEQRAASGDAREARAVYEAMLCLKPEQRMAVTLFYLDGFSVNEIAQTLGSPAGTIKTRLHAARKQLRKLLAADWEE